MTKSLVHIGTYTQRLSHVHGAGEGIHSVELDHRTGALRECAAVVHSENVSYACQSRDGRSLYAIAEICDYGGKRDGCLGVFATTPELSRIQVCSSSGEGPSYISLDQSGQWLFCVNYVAGNIVVLPVMANGLLGPANQTIQLAGKGPNRSRQDGPHPHAIVPSLDNRFVYVADLGTDQIITYPFKSETGKLGDKPFILKTGPGTGPRHMIFHPSGEIAYFVSELTSELSVCQVNLTSGEIEIVQTLSTVPADFRSRNHCSELCITSNGQHIYVANRGHDSVAVFEVNRNGTVALLSHADCGGQIPRHIALSPNEQFLLVANQESDQVVSLRRDPLTGQLYRTGHSIDIPTPAFVEFRRS
ncbi:MAG: lactonase family protein [Verrucomicrobiota bacterium]